MIGSRANCGIAADRLGRRVAVHLRHHHVHQHEVDVGVGLEHLDALAAVLGVDDADAVALQRAGQREDVADVVVDDEHLAPGEDLLVAT
jgi:hypothetical protein